MPHQLDQPGTEIVTKRFDQSTKIGLMEFGCQGADPIDRAGLDRSTHLSDESIAHVAIFIIDGKRFVRRNRRSRFDGQFDLAHASIPSRASALAGSKRGSPRRQTQEATRRQRAMMEGLMPSSWDEQAIRHKASKS
jgi:hypothetical protein